MDPNDTVLCDMIQYMDEEQILILLILNGIALAANVCINIIVITLIVKTKQYRNLSTQRYSYHLLTFALVL